MLVLTRRPGETIVMGNDVRVTVISVRHNLVRIGIQAPKSIVVDREEIHMLKELEREMQGIS